MCKGLEMRESQDVWGTEDGQSDQLIEGKEAKGEGWLEMQGLVSRGRKLGFLKKLIFIGVQLLYNVVLVSAVEQSEPAVWLTTSPLFLDSLPVQVTTEH